MSDPFLVIFQFPIEVERAEGTGEEGIKSQAISNLLWAFGNAHSKTDATQHLFVRMADKAMAILHKFNSQELSNLILAFAKMDFVHEPFLEVRQSVALVVTFP